MDTRDFHLLCREGLLLRAVKVEGRQGKGRHRSYKYYQCLQSLPQPFPNPQPILLLPYNINPDLPQLPVLNPWVPGHGWRQGMSLNVGDVGDISVQLDRQIVTVIRSHSFPQRNITVQFGKMWHHYVFIAYAKVIYGVNTIV